VEAYTLECLSGDIAGVIGAFSPDARAILIGHDWGAPVAWTTALVHPEKVRAVAGLSVPYVGIPTRSLTDIIEDNYTRHGRFFYMRYFAQEGMADAEMGADVRGALRRLYYCWSGDAPVGAWPLDKKLEDRLLTRLPDPNPFPAWLSDGDIDYYTMEFEGSGFRGRLNRYRNHDRYFHFLQSFRGRPIEQPSLYIAGDRDMVLSSFGDRVHLMKAGLTNLHGFDLLPGCGHWTQQERPKGVNERLLSWLDGL
jgi:pimeloyl-ACP methyl ester carboxylesterase